MPYKKIKSKIFINLIMQIEFLHSLTSTKVLWSLWNSKLNFLELSLHMVQTQGVEDRTSKQRVFLVVLTTF